MNENEPPSAAVRSQADPADSLKLWLWTHRGAVGALRLALDWRRKHGDVPFKWSDVRVFDRDLTRLVIDGLLDKVSGGYVIHEPAALSEAMGQYLFETTRESARYRSPVEAAPVPPGARPDLWSQIIGFDGVKYELNLALGAREPVHCLLLGPPASSKSLFLDAINTLPGSVMRYGMGMSQPGIRELAMVQKPAICVIDELEKMDDEAQKVLLSVLEGKVSVQHYGESGLQKITTRFFAACNTTRKMRPELVSRFHLIRMPEYTPEEFRRIAFYHLLNRGCSEAVAKVIAEGVSFKSRDLRDAVRIANMARTYADAVHLISQLGQEAQV
jgi:Holliday junction DNA helicase RuvB